MTTNIELGLIVWGGTTFMKEGDFHAGGATFTEIELFLWWWAFAWR